MFELEPLAFQNINWDAYIRHYKSTCGDSPTRCLDNKKIALDRPEAFLISLQECFCGDHLSMINFSFIGSCDVELLVEVLGRSEIHVASKEYREDRGTYLFILNGNLLQWRESIINLCGQTASKKARTFGNKAMMFFELAGYKFVWDRFKKVNKPDGTYILS